MKNVTVIEGQPATVEVSLSRASTNNVTVDYYTGNGTAINYHDYTSRLGTILFKPGELVKTRTISTTQDSNKENAEYFTFNLRNSVSAFIGTSQVNINVTDDD